MAATAGPWEKRVWKWDENQKRAMNMLEREAMADLLKPNEHYDGPRFGWSSERYRFMSRFESNRSSDLLGNSVMPSLPTKEQTMRWLLVQDSDEITWESCRSAFAESNFHVAPGAERRPRMGKSSYRPLDPTTLLSLENTLALIARYEPVALPILQQVDDSNSVQQAPPTQRHGPKALAGALDADPSSCPCPCHYSGSSDTVVMSAQGPQQHAPGTQDAPTVDEPAPPLQRQAPRTVCTPLAPLPTRPYALATDATSPEQQAATVGQPNELPLPPTTHTHRHTQSEPTPLNPEAAVFVQRPASHEGTYHPAPAAPSDEPIAAIAASDEVFYATGYMEPTLQYQAVQSGVLDPVAQAQMALETHIALEREMTAGQGTRRGRRGRRVGLYRY